MPGLSRTIPWLRVTYSYNQKMSLRHSRRFVGENLLRPNSNRIVLPVIFSPRTQTSLILRSMNFYLTTISPCALFMTSIYLCLKGLALYLSFLSLCWHCSCCGSFWFEICSSKWSCSAGLLGRGGSRSFAVAGPKCWNKLPVGLRDLSVDPETFARHLKTHLFRAVFSD